MTQTVPELATAYEWPPRPILDPEVASLILAERLQAAWDDLEAERLRVLLSATMLRKDLVDATLTEFLDAIVVFLAVVDENLQKFLTLHLGPRYEVAAVDASGEAVMTWTTAHETALTSLAIDTYEDFLQRAREAEQVSQAFAEAVREAAATEIPKLAAGGRTARQAADRLEQRLLTRYGITHVTYSNGAQVQVRTYARMAARTKSAVAYNAGTLNGAYAVGVRFVEIFDGTDCGFTFHEDPDKANGTVRHILEVAAHPIAHPQCTRAFGPRPDVTTRAEAKAATATTTAEQRADQATVDYVSSRPPAPRARAAQVRRARVTAQRQARQLGATGPEQVGDIVARILKERGLT